MPVVIEWRGYRGNEWPTTSENKAEWRVKDTAGTHRRSIAYSRGLFSIPERVYKNNSERGETRSPNGEVEQDMRWRPEAITPNQGVPLDVPRQAEFTQEKKTEHEPCPQTPEHALEGVEC
jgi:hypothetical protein